jgi:A118 family predicted phage portal protein
MKLFEKIKGLFSMLFQNVAKNEFNIDDLTTDAMHKMIDGCADIYAGVPPWLDVEDEVNTVNFAKMICSEIAELTTLAINIKIDGSARADWLNEQTKSVLKQLRHWVEYACAFGTVILKHSGDGVDMFAPSDFLVTDTNNGTITGCIFVNHDTSSDGKIYYTRLEYHRYLQDEEDKIYCITNKCYASRSRVSLGKKIDLSESPWQNLLEEVTMENIEKPLFGVLRTPSANNKDLYSPLGMPIFYQAVQELLDLDIAYSRSGTEIKDSKRTVLMDSDRLMPDGQSVQNAAAGFEYRRKQLKLPRYVRNVMGDGVNDFYQEINPSINTTERMVWINALLSQIGFKCGFSDGYFVFNEKTGMVTATQVESDDRRTIQTIKDMRDRLQACLDDLILALNNFADLYNITPIGAYETTYDFGDITYNEDEDRARWYSYVTAGHIKFWRYLVKFEGYTEEEAKAIEAETETEDDTLFNNLKEE